MKMFLMLTLLLLALSVQAEQRDCPEVYWQAVVSIDCHFDLIGETDTSQTWKYVCDTTFETVQLICWHIPMSPMPESGIEVLARGNEAPALVVYGQNGEIRKQAPGLDLSKKQIIR